MPKHCKGLQRHRGILRPLPFVLSMDKDPNVPADESPPPHAEAQAARADTGCASGLCAPRGARLPLLPLPMGTMVLCQQRAIWEGWQGKLPLRAPKVAPGVAAKSLKWGEILI